MRNDAFTLYAQWEVDRHNWMIVDETDFHPLIRAESPDELIAAFQRETQGGQQPSPKPA